ncbi:MAG TPA: hypothetical protein VLW85_08165 [Myxococcales bacterium]|nr:hypothetical protein [Myxococcales bacterium]
MQGETIEKQVERLALEYAQRVPRSLPLNSGVSLHDDLAIESLSLVSLALRLGNEFGVDVVEAGIELGGLKTFGDLVAMANVLKQQSTEIRSEST